MQTLRHKGRRVLPELKEKLVAEIVTFLILIAIALIVWKYVTPKFMYSQTEAEEEAHLKRLFGDAWREARDLGN
jgi:uncharacterized membrane protein